MIWTFVHEDSRNWDKWFVPLLFAGLYRNFSLWTVGPKLCRVLDLIKENWVPVRVQVKCSTLWICEQNSTPWLRNVNSIPTIEGRNYNNFHREIKSWYYSRCLVLKYSQSSKGPSWSHDESPMLIMRCSGLSKMGRSKTNFPPQSIKSLERGGSCFSGSGERWAGDEVPKWSKKNELRKNVFLRSGLLIPARTLPFRLFRAPATFQHLAFPAAYLDVVIIHSDSWAQHRQHVAPLLESQRQAELTANLKKCTIGWMEVQYLVYHLGRGQVRPLMDKSAAIVTCPQPKTKKEFRRFLGLAGYYWMFILVCSELTSPLTNLTRKGASDPGQWTEPCQWPF